MIVIIFLTALVLYSIVYSPSLFFNQMLMTLNVWLYHVYPSVFTFYLLAHCLLKSNLLSKISVILHPFFSFEGKKSYELLLVSFLIGNPGASSLVQQEYKENHITKSDAKKLVYLSLFMNPLFLISILGIKLSIWMMIIEWGVCFILNLFLKQKKKEEDILEKNTYHLPIFLNSISNAMQLLIQIAGVMVFINTIKYGITLVLNHLSLNQTFFKILCSLLEVTTGLLDLKTLHLSLPCLYGLMSGLIAFQGFSIFFQTLVVTNELQISFHQLFLIRFLEGILCGSMIYLIFL